MKHNPVNWFEIYVQDMARAKQFYESVFQLNLVAAAFLSLIYNAWSPDSARYRD